MTKTFSGPGTELRYATPSADVTSGIGYVIGARFVVSQDTVADPGEFTGISAGVHQLAADAADTFTEGQIVFWDVTNERVTNVSASGHFQIGTAAEALATPARIRVKLDDIAVVAVP